MQTSHTDLLRLRSAGHAVQKAAACTIHAVRCACLVLVVTAGVLGSFNKELW